jgi:hypothetical protein
MLLPVFLVLYKVIRRFLSTFCNTNFCNNLSVYVYSKGKGTPQQTRKPRGVIVVEV